MLRASPILAAAVVIQSYAFCRLQMLCFTGFTGSCPCGRSPKRNPPKSRGIPGYCFAVLNFLAEAILLSSSAVEALQCTL
ncbi:hypothetical protein B484DRAFT_63032 [Ochromonadaceae sp. CCMP2298]|nr:hypothetical protein B484DRAFT_63032 [Ochromonadaceae sp. CCMP2298]